MEQEFDLSVTPNAEIVRVHCSQFDEGTRKFIFHLYDEAQAFAIPAGATIELRATKADNKAYIINNITHPNIITFSGNTITITSEKQMTAAAGEQDFKIRILTEEDTHDTAIATARFTLVVDSDTINEDTDISDSVLPQIIDAARTSAAQAAGSATAAAASAESAESSKTSAAGSATSAETNALKSEGYAVGKQNGSDVGDTSPYYHNNSKYYSDRAENAAERAWQYSVNLPYIGSDGNWMIYDHATEEYIDSGVDASITLEIADITMIDASATPYVTNTGTNTDPIFHLFLPRGMTGKTAYQSAVEGGYTGTEAEFESELSHFKEWKEDAEDAADAAAEDASSAHSDALAAKAQADRAEMYADFVEPHFLIANNRIYIRDDATGEFIVANNRLYMKLTTTG